ncbi:hypothetical protein [Leucobacter chromiiresistens]|uniref:Uncharacterized protein n=1 Tax=Leucobacter chromiiresistens TaxID=1079994 RepID=A0A1H1BCF8_9MICO|nr:hypothetical protein [Leucobacter chromiiresistens]SDQ49587.1 hypothetical protein SAMN04488565_2729 [Leucobacter chromiiresistens]
MPDTTQIARFIVSHGEWERPGHPEYQRKIVLLDGDDEVTHWLNRDEALAVAGRLQELASRLNHPSEWVRRPTPISLADRRARDAADD